MFVGKGGYWEGRAGGQEGWFPCAAIREVTGEERNLLPTREPEQDYPTVTLQNPVGNSTQTAQYTEPSRPGMIHFWLVRYTH